MMYEWDSIHKQPALGGKSEVHIQTKEELDENAGIAILLSCLTSHSSPGIEGRLQGLLRPIYKRTIETFPAALHDILLKVAKKAVVKTLRDHEQIPSKFVYGIILRFSIRSLVWQWKTEENGVMQGSA